MLIPKQFVVRLILKQFVIIRLILKQFLCVWLISKAVYCCDVNLYTERCCLGHPQAVCCNNQLQIHYNDKPIQTWSVLTNSDGLLLLHNLYKQKMDNISCSVISQNQGRSLDTWSIINCIGKVLLVTENLLPKNDMVIWTNKRIDFVHLTSSIK